MDDSTRRSLVGTLVATLLGALVAWAGSDGSVTVGSVPVFAIVGALAFAVNWVAFVPANAAKTEHFYDLTGSITYLSVTIVALLLSDAPDLRAWIVAAMVVVWAVRLGSFLFRRVRKDGDWFPGPDHYFYTVDHRRRIRRCIPVHRSGSRNDQVAQAKFETGPFAQVVNDTGPDADHKPGPAFGNSAT